MCKGAQRKNDARAPSATAPAKVTSRAWSAWRCFQRAGASLNVASSRQEELFFGSPLGGSVSFGGGESLCRLTAAEGVFLSALPPALPAVERGPLSTFPSAVALTAEG